MRQFILFILNCDAFNFKLEEKKNGKWSATEEKIDALCNPKWRVFPIKSSQSFNWIELSRLQIISFRCYIEMLFFECDPIVWAEKWDFWASWSRAEKSCIYHRLRNRLSNCTSPTPNKMMCLLFASKARFDSIYISFLHRTLPRVESTDSMECKSHKHTMLMLFFSPHSILDF